MRQHGGQLRRQLHEHGRCTSWLLQQLPWRRHTAQETYPLLQEAADCRPASHCHCCPAACHQGSEDQTGHPASSASAACRTASHTRETIRKLCLPNRAVGQVEGLLSSSTDAPGCHPNSCCEACLHAALHRWWTAGQVEEDIFPAGVESSARDVEQGGGGGIQQVQRDAHTVKP